MALSHSCEVRVLVIPRAHSPDVAHRHTRVLACQVLGGAVVGASAYVLGFNGDFEDVSPTFMTYMALGTGVTVMVISSVACLATCNYTKGWAKVVLMVYSFLLFVVLAIVVGAAAMVWMKRSELKACE